MYTRKNISSDYTRSWPLNTLVVIGGILNLIALLTDGNGALVAVGCSLIAIGVALSSRASKRNKKHT